MIFADLPSLASLEANFTKVDSGIEKNELDNILY